MALIRSPLQKQQDELEQLENPLGSGAPSSTATTGSAGPTQQPAQPQTKPNQGGGFVNLVDYLKANEGRGAAMAQQLENPVKQKAQGLAQAEEEQSRRRDPSAQYGRDSSQPMDPQGYDQVLGYLNQQQQGNQDVAKDYGQLADEDTRRAMLGKQNKYTGGSQYEGYGASGEANFDNFLTGQAAGAQWQQQAQQYGTAAKAIGDQKAAVQGQRDEAAKKFDQYNQEQAAIAAKAEQARKDAARETERTRSIDEGNAAMWKAATGYDHRPNNDELKALLAQNPFYGTDGGITGQATLPPSTQEMMTDEEIARLISIRMIPDPNIIGQYINAMVAKYGIRSQGIGYDEYPENGGQGGVATVPENYNWSPYGD